MFDLINIKRTDRRILQNMSVHYSNPKGFVGRNICYAVMYDGNYYGAIVGGSATLHLPGRNEFFGLPNNKYNLNNIVNNIFYHVEKLENQYPLRNFTTFILKQFRLRIQDDWYKKYSDIVIGFESLVELPRTGECYIRDNWKEVGITKGFGCKRVSGKGTDCWTGKRIWNTVDLKPKKVLCRFA